MKTLAKFILVTAVLLLATPSIAQSDVSDVSEELKLAALEALIAAPADKALPLVSKVLEGNHSNEVKERALFILSQIDEPEAQATLLRVAREDGELGAGGAEKFIDFLSEELFPLIEEKYPTRDYRVLIGHSYGGLFVVYALVSRPELFRAYLACSPWFGEVDEAVISDVEKHLKTGPPMPKLLYIAHEPISSPGIEDRIMRLKQILEANERKDFGWEHKKYMDADHSNLPLKAIPDALDFFFPGIIQD